MGFSSLPISPQDFNDEFSDLDGVVRQRRQDMEGYSSSGSQTPESENSRGLRDFCVLTEIELSTIHLYLTPKKPKPPKTQHIFGANN